MSSKEMVDLCLQHSLFSWSATGKVDPIPVARAEGIYLYSPEGQRWIDFNSQLMSVNIGHGHPKVIEAIQKQAATLAYAYPGMATEIRAKLSRSASPSSCPGDINTFFYTLGGAEANENAIKAARLFTGRHKILARYRSYHGATHGVISLTGDPRRWPNEPGMARRRARDGSVALRVLVRHDDEEIVREQPHLPGGGHPVRGPEERSPRCSSRPSRAPTASSRRPRATSRASRRSSTSTASCSSATRSWRLGPHRKDCFAFEHGDIVPDIVTMAKGLTSSYMPLGVMGVSDRIANHFRENVFWGGLTYNAHPMCLAAADAVIDVLESEKLVENSARMGEVMRGHMERIEGEAQERARRTATSASSAPSSCARTRRTSASSPTPAPTP
jgi:taurine--2-oxoglutarate transaminase